MCSSLLATHLHVYCKCHQRDKWENKTPASSLYAAECQRELVRDEILVLAWHRFWLKGHSQRQ